MENTFLTITQNPEVIREKIEKYNYIKFENFYLYFKK